MFGQCYALNVFFWVFEVFANHPTVHSRGVRRLGSLAVAVDVSDRLQVVRDTSSSSPWCPGVGWSWRNCCPGFVLS